MAEFPDVAPGSGPKLCLLTILLMSTRGGSDDGPSDGPGLISSFPDQNRCLEIAGIWGSESVDISILCDSLIKKEKNRMCRKRLELYSHQPRTSWNHQKLEEARKKFFRFFRKKWPCCHHLHHEVPKAKVGKAPPQAGAQSQGFQQIQP